MHHVLVFAVPPDAVAEAQARTPPSRGSAGRASPAVESGPPPMRRRRSAAGFPARARLRSRRGRASAWTPGRGSSSRCTTTCSPARAFADRTTVDLHYAATPVAKRALVLPISNATFVIPPGASEHGHRRAAGAGRIMVGVGRPAAHAPARHRHQTFGAARRGRVDARDRHPHWTSTGRASYYKQPHARRGRRLVRLAAARQHAGSAATWGARTRRRDVPARSASSPPQIGSRRLRLNRTGARRAARAEPRRGRRSRRRGRREPASCAGPSGRSSAPTARDVREDASVVGDAAAQHDRAGSSMLTTSASARASASS